jgi:hypothetical protein
MGFSSEDGSLTRRLYPGATTKQRPLNVEMSAVDLVHLIDGRPSGNMNLFTAIVQDYS